MSDIQQARDVLAKWRGHPLHGNWSPVPLLLDNAVYTFDVVDESSAYAANSDDEAAMRLIVGTAGNPDLLDAIDEELRWGLDAPSAITRRIAAAIIAAYERMTA